jgi:hypothetical protein
MRICPPAGFFGWASVVAALVAAIGLRRRPVS